MRKSRAFWTEKDKIRDLSGRMGDDLTPDRNSGALTTLRKLCFDRS